MGTSYRTTKAETIAIPCEMYPRSLKQTLLLFDRIIIPNFSYVLKACEIGANRQSKFAEEFRHIFNNLEYLAHKNLVLDAPISIQDLASIVTADDPDEYISTIRPILNSAVAHENNENNHINNNIRELLRGIVKQILHHRISKEVAARVNAAHLSGQGVEAMPINARYFKSKSFGQASIIKVILNQIPAPDDSVPWDRIIDFRNDTEAKGYLVGLRTWMREFATGSLTQNEAEQKLEWLLFKQTQFMKMHRIRTNVTTMGALFVMSAEAIENLLKIKLGSVVKSLVSITEQKAGLLEAELKSPTPELSYLLRVQNAFSNSSD